MSAQAPESCSQLLQQLPRCLCPLCSPAFPCPAAAGRSPVLPRLPGSWELTAQPPAWPLCVPTAAPTSHGSCNPSKNNSGPLHASLQLSNYIFLVAFSTTLDSHPGPSAISQDARVRAAEPAAAAHLPPLCQRIQAGVLFQCHIYINSSPPPPNGPNAALPSQGLEIFPLTHCQAPPHQPLFFQDSGALWIAPHQLLLYGCRSVRQTHSHTAAWPLPRRSLSSNSEPFTDCQ